MTRRLPKDQRDDPLYLEAECGPGERWQVAYAPGEKPRAVQRRADGSITLWTGNIGSTGKPFPHVTVRDPRNREERDAIRWAIRSLRRGIERTSAMYAVEKARETL